MQNTKVIGICYQYSVSIDIVYSTIHIGLFSNHVNNAYIASILHAYFGFNYIANLMCYIINTFLLFFISI